MDTFVADLAQYFAADPLRLLYLVGGAGGVWFWWEKWADRTRVSVRLLSHSIGGTSGQPTCQLLVEVVNLGKVSTSLRPHVHVAAYRARRSLKVSPLDVLDPDRLLAPHQTRRISIEGQVAPEFAFAFYKRFTIRLTRGRGSSLYLRSSGRVLLGAPRYWAEVALYRWFGVRRYYDASLRALDAA